MRYASNAVLAKARAMYAGRITSEEYDALVSCKSLSELIGLLQRRKRYAVSLEKAPSSITPAQAEELLRMSVYEQLAILGRYEISERNTFFRFYIVKREIEQLLRCIRLLIGGRSQEYLTELPPFFNSLTELNLFRLAEADSMEDVLQVLDGTPYRRILSPYVPIYKEKGVYLQIEAAFHAYLFAFLFDSAKRDKSDKKQMEEALRLYVDAEYITSMYRLKKMRAGDEKIYSAYLVKNHTAFSKAQIDAMQRARDEKEFMAALAKTAYGEELKALDYGDTEKVIAEYVCEKYRKGLRFYTDPAAVMVCYMFLAENEIMNIIRIIEGIRYQISPNEIKSVLTGVRSESGAA